MPQEVFSGMNSESVPTLQGHWVLIQENCQWVPLQRSVEEKQSKRMNLPPRSASVFVVCQLLLCVASVLESNDQIS